MHGLLALVRHLQLPFKCIDNRFILVKLLPLRGHMVRILGGFCEK